MNKSTLVVFLSGVGSVALAQQLSIRFRDKLTYSGKKIAIKFPFLRNASADTNRRRSYGVLLFLLGIWRWPFQQRKKSHTYL